MSDGPLSRLDLNLLVSLDVLLVERSVTKAAEVLHLSQPAVSAHLARLRIHFRDPILRRTGNTFELTPFADRLVEQTNTAVEAARRVFEHRTVWDPSESDRVFTVYGSDYGISTIGARAMQLAAHRAPRVQFRFMNNTAEFVDSANETLRSTDAMLLPHGFVSHLPHVDLFSDSWLVVAATSNDLISDELTLEDVELSPWVLTYQSRTAFTSAAQQLQQRGMEPQVDCVLESFLSMPFFIAGTRRLGFIQAGLSDYVESQPGIRLLAAPFKVPDINLALWWHPSQQLDPSHVWMRQLFREAALTQPASARTQDHHAA